MGLYAGNQFVYSRERRRFGGQCLFTDRTQLMLSIQPSYKLRLSYILKSPITRSTQLAAQSAFSEMLTENVEYEHTGMLHYEGGWPRDLNMHDEEQTTRYRKKIERDDIWGQQVPDLIRTAMDLAAQNTAVNIYQEFFADLPPELGQNVKASFEARQYNVFHDPIVPNRTIANVDFKPGDVRTFLAQHMSVKRVKEEEVPGSETTVRRDPPPDQEVKDVPSENAFFVWDSKNSLRPETILEANESITKAVFCPKDDRFIAGGSSMGKVYVWNSIEGGDALRRSEIEVAHREPMSAICWVHSKTNSEFYTGSYDGVVKFWDGRDLSGPTREILMDPVRTDDQLDERSHGVTFLEFEYTIPVRFIVGTDQGFIFIGNRKGIVPTDTLTSNYKLIMGPIRSIHRNPFFVKNFLIVGDWVGKVWSEECKANPTTLVVKRKNQMVCGAWSATRCSLFVTADTSGQLDFWDLLLHHREPIFSLKFKHKISCIKFRPDGHLLAVALENGDLHMLELDKALKYSGHKDKGLMAALFERELHRTKLLQGRIEEMKLRRRTTWELQQRLQAEEEGAEDEPELDPDDPAQFLQIIERDYEFKETLRIFVDITTKVDKKRSEREYVMERTDFEMDYPPPQLQIIEEEKPKLEQISTPSAPEKTVKEKPKKRKGKV